MNAFDDADALFNAVASIFAVTVLLDKRKRDAELVEFTHACMVHNHTIRPGRIVSRRQLMQWFEAHREELEGRLEGDADHAFKASLLTRIHDEGLQRSVLSSIFTISVSDYELHDEESAFINRALSVWNANMPTPAEVEAVA